MKKSIYGLQMEGLVLIGLLCLGQALMTQAQPSGQRGGGRSGFDSGALLAGAMIQQGDQNGDQLLGNEEFSALAGNWFAKLDPDQTGKVSQEQMSEHFGEILSGTTAPGGRSGGRRGGPARFVGRAFFTATDANKDGSITASEFNETFERWFAEWDTDNTGSLDRVKLVAGLNGALPRARRRGGFGPRTPDPDDATGFTAIFDGETLDGWDGDPKFWRAENGEIVGESSEENRVEQNTFLIWRDGITKDFELKLEFKISDGANSGVQYRSSLLPERGQWAMKGYQADMDSSNRYTGMIYEERGRRFLAPRGQFARFVGVGQTKLIATVGESDALKAFIKQGDWNQLHIIAKGNTIVQSINGHVMSALVDDDEQGRAMEGLLGLQIHTGPPMKLQFRQLLYKEL